MSSHINKKASIKKIFENMEYENLKENSDLAINWCKKHGNNFKTSQITSEKIELLTNAQNVPIIIETNKVTDENVANFLKECREGLDEWSKCSDIKQSQIINKIATEIDKNSTLVCQLEMVFRNIFVRDTKNFAVSAIKECFQYYSGWSAIKTKNFSNLSSYGYCLVNLSENTPLSLLGMILAPCLAAGNTLILNVDKKLVPISFLVRELAILAGVPKGLIQIVYGNLQTLLKQDLQKVVYIGDLFHESYTSLQINEDISLCNLHLGKSNMLVFDSSDLDSVTEAVLEASLSYRSYFPWSINQVFVQETVFETLKNKLNSKFENLKVVEDSSFKIGNVTKDSMVRLKFGHRGTGSEEGDKFLYVLPFRTANEGVQLVNNIKLGLAISVWTENMSLANEINSKLKGSLIWYNSWGKIDPSLSFTPYKKSGRGYFCGKEGFLEFMSPKKREFVKKNFDPISNNLRGDQNSNIFFYFGGFKKPESGSDIPNKNDVQKFVEVSLKSQESWKKLTAITRGAHLRKFGDNSQWLEVLYEWSMFPILSVKEPQGVVLIEFYSERILNLIFGAVFLGNSVIILNKNVEKAQILKELCSKCNLPSGVLNVINFCDDTIEQTLKNHQEITSYFAASEGKVVKIGEKNKVFDLRKINFDSFDDISKVVTKNKNVFFSCGESFI